MAPSCTLSDLVLPANAPFEQILDVLTKRGGVALRGLIDPKDALSIQQELQPLLDAQAPGKKAETGCVFFFSPASPAT